MKPLAVSAVVPAAGLSSRTGGPNKMLSPYAGGTMVGQVVKTLLACGLDVVVVTGRDAEQVAQAVEPARSVHNERYKEGLGTSIACGVAACAPDRSILIALGDMPDLSAEVVRLLADASEPDAIVAPQYADEPERPGHPVIFGPAFRMELLGLEGDEGAKRVLQAHRDKLRLLPVPGHLPDYDSV